MISSDQAVPPVHLVGAGVGDPELLTLKAARLLSAAEVVVYDQLVGDEILAFAAPNAECVPAGRRAGHIIMPHETVVDRLASAALAGKQVVRLKGGDPVVFGRGGEESLELARRGIPTVLVPGVSSAIAGPELAGIPVTHRGMSTGFMVVTGQCAPDAEVADLEVAAAFDGTVVVLMGATRLHELCDRLVRAGRAGATPASVVERAGLPDQRVITGNLDDLPTIAAKARVRTPAVLVVGDVVSVREQIAHAEQAAQIERATT